ncbi:MAG: DUF92 domain-containing protein [Terriglobia bacterium]
MTRWPHFALARNARTAVWTPRRLLQISTVIPAFLLFSVTWTETAGLLLLILFFSAFVLLPSDIALDRNVSDSAGHLRRIPLYPLALLLLVFIFPHHLDVVAAAWALLAAGDGMAGAVGETLGAHPLPFNSSKTWEGFAAFIIFGWPVAFLLLAWVDWRQRPSKALLVSLAAAGVGALVESLPVRLDDNITVPLLCGGFIFCASRMTAISLERNLPYLGVRVALAVGINAAFALLAWRLRQVTASGAVAGFLLGAAIYMGFGYKSFLLLLCFFVLGSAATRAGYASKLRRGIAERRRGARSWREATANTLAAAFFAILVITTPDQAAFLIALVAALAEAAGDTVASEIGKWASGQAFLITTLQPVRAGEDGGISLAGTAAGFSASGLLVIVAYTLGLCGGWGALAALLAAFAGNLADSALGALFERRSFLTNAAVNFMGTTLAGALALAWALH